jgi:endonuclease III
MIKSSVGQSLPHEASRQSTLPKKDQDKKTIQQPATTKVFKRKVQKGQSRHVPPLPGATSFGLIQESIANNLYHLCIQAMLWNQTSGTQARPVFHKLISQYPSPAHLAVASLSDLTALLQPLGLHNIRARRCILFATQWLEAPPTRDKTYIRRGYPAPGGEEGFEIAHLAGMGPYAIDSFRIFHRDVMRGVARDWLGSGAGEGFEPEWMRVVPLDKELKAYVEWRWLVEGREVKEEHEV